MVVLILAAACGLSLVMALAWMIQRATGNVGWVDVVWSFGTGLAGAALALAPLDGPPGWRQWLVAALAALWSLRLGLHVAQRVRAGPEDGRYTALRRDWGGGFQRRIFWFLQIQAMAAFLLALAILLAARNPAPGFRMQDLGGLLILVLAIGGEALADAQLARFKARERGHGRICTEGLWGWSRHPNYFFEWLAWLAYPCFAIDPDGGWPWGWLALLGPVMMYWLLVHVSGIPPVEQQMLRSRGEAYRRVQARISRFFPWPPMPEGPR